MITYESNLEPKLSNLFYNISTASSYLLNYNVSAPQYWYLDADDDGYSTGPAVRSNKSPGTGYKTFGIIAYEDCNDGPDGGRINKGAQEICNGIDDDCDGLIDNADPSVAGRILWYLDADDDGYSTGSPVLSCSSPGASYKSFGVIGYEDCNDGPTGGRVNKGAQEVCNGIDDDCDGLIDNADPSVEGRILWYLDADDDGYSTGSPVLSCSSPGASYKSFGIIGYQDCDDNPATGGRINPGAIEELNNKDDDCDGVVDDGMVATIMFDNGNDETAKQGTEESLAKRSIIKVFPNPTHSYFTLRLKSETNEKININIFDLTGRKVYSTNGSANQTYTFGYQFPKGTYLVNILEAGKSTSIRLIKQ